MEQEKESPAGPTIFISTQQAKELIEEKTGMKITKVTVITWAEKFEIGHKVGGRWRINKTALIDFIIKDQKD